MRGIVLFCSGLALVWLPGCAREQKSTGSAAPVKGTVTLNGNRVSAGEIHFGRTDAPPRVLEIKDGAFSGEAPVGKNQVEVYVYEEGPPSDKYGGTRLKKNVAPEKYWGPNSVLEATVS